MSVLSYLEGLARSLNLAEREAASISRSISTLSQRLSSYFNPEMQEAILFGSFSRGTVLPRWADPYSDVDLMVVFNNSYNYKPQTYIGQLKRFAEYYYSSSEIRQSHPTVVLSLNHISFDLVPAYRSFWTGLRIPGSKNGFSEWMSTDPISFCDEMMDANAVSNYKLKPLIRLMKYWNTQNGYIYNSYELEQRLTAATYWRCSNLKDFVFSAVANLPTWWLSSAARAKVERAQRIVASIKTYEGSGLWIAAEEEIQVLL